MFADPLSNLMLVILLFFAGLVIMFAFIMRHLHLLANNTDELRRQLSVSIMDMERQIAQLRNALELENETTGTPTRMPLPSALPPKNTDAGGVLAQMDDLVELLNADRPKNGQA